MIRRLFQVLPLGDVLRARAASRVLDDRAGSCGRVAREQASVHALLSSQPPEMTPTPEGLRRRIACSLEEITPAPAPRVRPGLVGLTACLGLAVLGAAGLLVLQSAAPQAHVPQRPLAGQLRPFEPTMLVTGEGNGATVDVEAFGPDQRVASEVSPIRPPLGGNVPSLAASASPSQRLGDLLADPLYAQAQALREDTRSAADALLSRLPVRTGEQRDDE